MPSPSDFAHRTKLGERMRSIRKKDTRPEMIVRRLAHGLGFRYRLHRRDLPGTPDLVFPGPRKVILVHGCFWHQHDCPLGNKQPSTNQEYWLPKLQRNVERDAANSAKLQNDGWEVLVIWECETRKPDGLAGKIRTFLKLTKQ
jgi:DNA mismatch endonuclease (patch repair protein)